jgi:hypothetical protein
MLSVMLSVNSKATLEVYVRMLIGALPSSSALEASEEQYHTLNPVGTRSCTQPSRSKRHGTIGGSEVQWHHAEPNRAWAAAPLAGQQIPIER